MLILNCKSLIGELPASTGDCVLRKAFRDFFAILAKKLGSLQFLCHSRKQAVTQLLAIMRAVFVLGGCPFGFRNGGQVRPIGLSRYVYPQ